MEETPDGTPVGVEDPYEHAGACDHLTGDGRCRFALDRAGDDPGFAADRRADGYDCVVAGEGVEWRDCPHYRDTTDGKECRRCGLPETRMAHDSSRPLVEEHHLSYGGSGGTGRRGGAGGTAANANDEGDRPSHEITVALCRWCHAKVHGGFARVDDDASPVPEAIAERESRRGREMDEMGFSTASERSSESDG
ncbi:DUF7097 family protein [Candidatus Halobonum tyrrellensis]|uniref:Uncharacterized protein n=1 Tax=Candidatus Halobonum tyrrellensis G22 TaxID=1324957 RepID=V4HJP9_9EURY|nr:hypothetical protein [Candidatus Halobonum tyrrellensis]ESP88144.1 hypothetical protein K933_10652 [Candidatus Halobonum tyrrellensis G22]